MSFLQSQWQEHALTCDNCGEEMPGVAIGEDDPCPSCGWEFGGPAPPELFDKPNEWV